MASTSYYQRAPQFNLELLASVLTASFISQAPGGTQALRHGKREGTSSHAVPEEAAEGS